MGMFAKRFQPNNQLSRNEAASLNTANQRQEAKTLRARANRQRLNANRKRNAGNQFRGGQNHKKGRKVPKWQREAPRWVVELVPVVSPESEFPAMEEMVTVL